MSPMSVLAYVLLCLVVAFIGRNSRVRFVGAFVLSLLLTPVIMGLVYLVAEPRKTP
ncbi:hypothetical protein [Pollutimonas subterranea]|uniref:hypothetical protein n=1 Tax=Pollutimonas subterranea TaxID=2045210 RepID=UPI0013045E54|nr:hypothetical protein [Pollutimonas subterranea]